METYKTSPRQTSSLDQATDDLFGASPFNAMLVWSSFLVGFFVPIMPFIGVVFAYINRGRSDPGLRTHYDAAITTFWVTLILGFVGGLLTWILIGFPILFFLAVWTIWRSIRGMMKANSRRPMWPIYSQPV